MVGGLPYVNPSMVAVPADVVTDIAPLAPVPTTAVILVAESTVNDLAAVPPKRTVVAPVRLLPLIVMVVQLVPPNGEKEVIIGPV